MDIAYERKGDKSYMVMKGDSGKTGYEWQMLKSNEIKELLPFFTMERNGETMYYYDISGKESLKEYVKREGLTPEVLKKIVFYLGNAVEKLENYLISVDHLIISEDTVFLERHKSEFKMLLCYQPGNNTVFTEQINSLFGYIIGEAPHSEKEFTALCYRMYEETVKDNFSFKTIREMAANLCEEAIPEGPAEEMLPPFTEEPKEEIYVEKVDPHRPQSEYEEEDEFESLIDKIIKKFKNRKDQKKEKPGKEKLKKEKHKKKKKEPEDDLIYEPEEIRPEETVLLSHSPASPGGRLVYEGTGNEQDFEIEKNETAIGSLPTGNDVVLKSPGVSRHHARIIKEGSAYYIVDLNSTNGTFINGKPLSYKEKVPLKIRDLISFGDAAFRLL
ncbi:MAG: FHA domain-containing protein [Lachnospiraceae bacterium]|nr:FHA domain-containing protein [Lachnospiraceae bacterium]